MIVTFLAVSHMTIYNSSKLVVAFPDTMASISRKNLMYMFILLTATFLLGYFTKPLNPLLYHWRPPCTCCDRRLTTDTITPLRDNRTFIIAPYSDNRIHNNRAVRILSIIHHKEVKDLYCWFCCTVNNSVKVSQAAIDIHTDRFGFPYSTTDLVCMEPPGCHAKYLSVHKSPTGNMTQLPLFRIQNQDTRPFSANFTVCISTMFGNYSNVLQFIQTMEMYRILGAQRVMIYLNNCSTQVEKVIQYYIAEGIVEVIPWPIQQYLRPSRSWRYSVHAMDVGYYGQVTTLNDCIYRNMYRSKFVLLNDLDEIILPIKHQTWDSLMESLQQQNPGVGVFLFENHIFSQTVTTDGNFSNISSWKSLPGSNILQHVHREPDRPNYFNARKMIVDPRKVIQTSVHSVLKSIGGSKKVSLEAALVYHCRTPLQKLLKTSLIEDKTIWRYNASLIRNVNTVLNQVDLQK
ncbi:beta-1,4-galactosyltransferase galt-1-like isoform X3 [Pseudophryne corroboree]|uniref:beta-1,4-galactosyltransferase galt-1-like isoform X3 n=1 Tax=Pseudophryne corroboree TaxID=495146 RepID=UPI003081D6A0